MLRLLVALSLAVACSAYAPAAPLQLSKVAASRADLSMMARAPPKKAVAKKAAPAKAAPKKAAPKPAPVKKSVPKKAAPKKTGVSPQGKGGIFPWITNEPGTYAKVMKLSSVDFTSDAGDAWIGWGFMPKSVKALYPKCYKGMFGTFKK